MKMERNEVFQFKHQKEVTTKKVNSNYIIFYCSSSEMTGDHNKAQRKMLMLCTPKCSYDYK